MVLWVLPCYFVTLCFLANSFLSLRTSSCLFGEGGATSLCQISPPKLSSSWLRGCPLFFEISFSHTDLVISEWETTHAEGRLSEPSLARLHLVGERRAHQALQLLIPAHAGPPAPNPSPTQALQQVTCSSRALVSPN